MNSFSSRQNSFLLPCSQFYSNFFSKIRGAPLWIEALQISRTRNCNNVWFLSYIHSLNRIQVLWRIFPNGVYKIQKINKLKIKKKQINLERNTMVGKRRTYNEWIQSKLLRLNCTVESSHSPTIYNQFLFIIYKKISKIWCLDFSILLKKRESSLVSLRGL